MVTKPQWATPERQEHLLQLFVKHQNRCRQGHPACPDLRHHYQWCAVAHENHRTKSLRQQLLVLDPTNGAQQLELHEQLLAEYARQAENCPDVQHYLGHVSRAMFGGRPPEVLLSLKGKKGARRLTSKAKYQNLVPLSAYAKHSEGAIDSWKAEDREERLFLWKLEQQHINDGTYGQYGSDFDPVARDVYYQDKQPVYFFLGFGVSAVSKQRIAIIRVPSTSMRLHIDVSQVFKGASISKNKRRKMARYHSQPPAHIWEQVDTLCKEAVAEWWASRS